MPDLAQQIRERLEAWAPVDPLAPASMVAFSFTTDEHLSPEDAETWRAAWTRAHGEPPNDRLHIAYSGRFYPGFTQMKAAILAAVDEHQQAYALVWDVPRPPSGEPRRELHPWCSCQEHDGMTDDERWPCRTLRAIAAALGIAIHDSRIEGTDG